MRRGISSIILAGLAVAAVTVATGQDRFSFDPRSAASRFGRPLKPLEFFTGRRDEAENQPKEEPLPTDVDSRSAGRRPASNAAASSRAGETQSSRTNRFADESSLSRFLQPSETPSQSPTRPTNAGPLPEVKNYHRALFGSDPPPRRSAAVQQAVAEEFSPNDGPKAQLLGYDQARDREESYRSVPAQPEERSRPAEQTEAKPAWYEQLRASQRIDQPADAKPARPLPPADSKADLPIMHPAPQRTAERREFDDIRQVLAERQSPEPTNDSQPSPNSDPTEGNVSPFEQVAAEPTSRAADAPAALPNWAEDKPLAARTASRSPSKRDESRRQSTANDPKAATSHPPAHPSNAKKRAFDALRFQKPMDAPSTAFPHEAAQFSADGQAPAVTVEWVKRSAINVGQECQCDLVVKNGGDVAARDVVVEAYFPDSVRLTSAEPNPDESMDHLTWRFDNLAAGADKTIHISMIPSKRGDLATRALVRFTGAAAGTFHVEEPLLKLAVKGPTEVNLGDPASQIVTVSNPGSGIAQNVVVAAYIPDGLDHPQGKEVKLAIGSLNAGESRQVRLPLAAVGGGEQRIAIEAEAGNALKQVAESRITIVAPVLKLELDGPGLRYIGRSADYRLTIRNDGTAATNNVRAIHQVPEGFEFVQADKGGTYDASAGTVSWFLGRLDAGDGVEFHVRLKPRLLGDHAHRAAAYSEHGSRAEAQTATRVDGTAALVLKIADLDDPVEVGVETGYEIRVQNEGTKAAQNVVLSCELPGGVELVSADGPAEFVTENGLMVFKPLRELAPDQTVTFQVRVRGTAEGNRRFRARLASDSIQEPLIFEELTKFYQD